MGHTDNLIDDVQKSHIELSDLVGCLEKALEESDYEKAREVFHKIEGMAKAHFKFEENFLYPRMRRLAFEVIEKLFSDQRRIRSFIEESRNALSKDRLKKNSLSNLSQLVPVISNHLKDCGDLVYLAEKFGSEEKKDLNQKFRECSRDAEIEKTKRV